MVEYREVEVPVEKIVIKEIPVEVPVERIVEKIVTKEVPVEVEKIVTVERIVEKPVIEYRDRVVEKPVIEYRDRVVETERVVEVPVYQPVATTRVSAPPSPQVAPQVVYREPQVTVDPQVYHREPQVIYAEPEIVHAPPIVVRQDEVQSIMARPAATQYATHKPQMVRATADGPPRKQVSRQEFHEQGDAIYRSITGNSASPSLGVVCVPSLRVTGARLFCTHES